jgi:hypothetical protein
MDLQWDLKDPQLTATIEEAFQDAQEIINVSRNLSL